MKKRLLAVSLVLVLFLAGCGKPTSTPRPTPSPTSRPTQVATPIVTPTPRLAPTPTPAPGGKDAVVAVLGEMAPIVQMYEQLWKEWNTWRDNASNADYERDFLNRARYMSSEMTKLHDRLVRIAAPQDLTRLKDLLASAIAKSTEYFDCAQEYARTGNEAFAIRGKSAGMESERFYSLVGDELTIVEARYKLR